MASVTTPLQESPPLLQESAVFKLQHEVLEQKYTAASTTDIIPLLGSLEQFDKAAGAPSGKQLTKVPAVQKRAWNAGTTTSAEQKGSPELAHEAAATMPLHAGLKHEYTATGTRDTARPADNFPLQKSFKLVKEAAADWSRQARPQGCLP